MLQRNEYPRGSVDIALHFEVRRNQRLGYRCYRSCFWVTTIDWLNCNPSLFWYKFSVVIIRQEPSQLEQPNMVLPSFLFVFFFGNANEKFDRWFSQVWSCAGWELTCLASLVYIVYSLFLWSSAHLKVWRSHKPSQEIVVQQQGSPFLVLLLLMRETLFIPSHICNALVLGSRTLKIAYTGSHLSHSGILLEHLHWVPCILPRPCSEFCPR